MLINKILDVKQKKIKQYIIQILNYYYNIALSFK